MMSVNIDQNESPFDEPFVVEITDAFDLHSFEPREVKAAVTEYLAQARKKFKVVRIIHGKGIGVQREMVRGVLSNSDFVKKFSSADEFGNWGATIVWFK